ncbi:MAG: FecR family protein, partial [Thermoanaerobaculia bacterium]
MRPATRTPRIVALVAAVLVPAASALAQREGYTYLSYVGSEVSLVSPADEDTSARPNTPVLPGDVLVTGNASRVEAVLADGNVVRLDGRSELRFERLNRTFEADDDRTVLALARGTIAVEVREVSTRERALRVDTDDASIVSPARSLFRVDAGRRGTEVYVLGGRVEVSGRGGRALVRAGQYAFVTGDAEIELETAGAPRDRFARFLDERRDRADRRDVTRYVDSEYSYDSDAASFDDFGSWTYVGSLGSYGWRPNVDPGWTPYSLGTWRWTPSGLTWVSYEPWGWLPYHYGSWAWDAALGWTWIPGGLYAPAWVYWTYTPEWTGWCPAGWYGYYDHYYRSTRAWRGNERGLSWLPQLRGRVEVAQIDRRGWNFAPTSRLGARLDPARDVTRGDRISFPRGQTVVVATAPLRVARGLNPASSVQEAIRRIALGEVPARGAVNEGLASILRRDRTLDAAGQEELRRSVARAGRDLGPRTQSSGTLGRPGGVEAWREMTGRPTVS